MVAWPAESVDRHELCTSNRRNRQELQTGSPRSMTTGGRQRLRRHRPAPLLPIPPRTGNLHHQAAPGCRSLRSCATPTTGSNWPAPGEGITSTHPSSSALTTPTCTGTPCRCPGTTAPSAPWHCLPTPPFGSSTAIHPYPSAGCWSAIPRVNWTLRPCSVPTKPWLQSRSSSGLCCAGNWRSPARKCGLQPGRGNSTPMVRPRHCPHQARPDWSVFLGGVGCSLAATRKPHHPAHGGLVCQACPHFRGCQPSPWCDHTCGRHPRVFQCQCPTTTGKNPFPICIPSLSITSPAPLELTKSSLEESA